MPPRDAQGRVSCDWYEALPPAQRLSVAALMDQLLYGGDKVGPAPKLAYDWLRQIASTDPKDGAYARAITLLDPNKRQAILADPQFTDSALPDIDLNADLICTATSAMVTAAALGHEAALRWNYADELANARAWLYPLDKDILSPDWQDRYNTMVVFAPHWEAALSIEAVEGVLYTMHLEGYDVPEEARTRLEAIVRGDFAEEVSYGYVLHKPRRFRRYMSTAHERYCP